MNPPCHYQTLNTRHQSHIVAFMMDIGWCKRATGVSLALLSLSSICSHVAAFVGAFPRFRHAPLRAISYPLGLVETGTVMKMDLTNMGEEPSSRADFGKFSAAALLGVTLVSSPTSSPAIGDLFETQNQTRFAQHVVVNVPDMDRALDFYVKGLGMQILRTRVVERTNTTFVGFGPEALSVPPDFRPGVSTFNSYGGHFSIELNALKKTGNAEDIEADDVFYDAGTGVQYIQIAVDNYRISKVVANGGTVLSGFGYLEVVAPGGLRLNILSGERRDPPMFVAVKVRDMKKAIKWYTEVLGMSQLAYPLARVKDSPYEPEQPKNSVFMAFDGDSTGMLLIPAGRNEAINVGSVYSKLAILADGVEQIGERIGASFVGKAPGVGTRVAVTEDPDGYGIALVEYEDWVKELPKF
ncbi:unnamed protein product [Choristocarpus tenellus]